MKKKTSALLDDNRRKLVKAIDHLDYSYKKIQKLSLSVGDFDEESLETWESFCSRFARAADIFLAKYLRAAVLLEDPGFEGTLRDLVNQGEKIGLVDDARAWMGIRELRNAAAHDYSEEDLAGLFARVKKEAPRILALRKVLAK